MYLIFVLYFYELCLHKIIVLKCIAIVHGSETEKVIKFKGISLHTVIVWAEEDFFFGGGGGGGVLN